MTHKSCNKHKGMKIVYDPEKYGKCFLCAVEQQNELLISALRGFWQLVSLHIESMELITNQSPEEKRIEVKKRFQETAEQLYKDLDKVAELRDALYA